MTEAQRLVKQIIKTGLHLEEIAIKLKVSYFTCYRWLRGITNPRPLTIDALKNLLKKREGK